MDEVARTRLKRLGILVGTALFFCVILVVFREILVPFIIAVVLAYVLHPAVKWLHGLRLRKRQLPRWAAVLVLYVVLFGAIGVFATTMLPRLLSETTDLVRAAPGAIAHVRDDVIPSIETWADQRLGHFLGPLRMSGGGAGTGELDAGPGPDADADGEPAHRVEATPPRELTPAEHPRPRPRTGPERAVNVPAIREPPVEPRVPPRAEDGGPRLAELDARAHDAQLPEAGMLAAGPDAGEADADAGDAAVTGPDADVGTESGDGGDADVLAVEPILPPPVVVEPEAPIAPSLEPTDQIEELAEPEERTLLRTPGPPAPPDAITIRPIRGGGFAVELPRDGVIVEQIDDGKYRIGSQRRAVPQSGLDLRRQFDDMLEGILEQSEEHVLSALRFTQRAVFITVELVFNGIMSLMLAAFILATTPKIMDFFRSLVPPRYRIDFDQLVARIDRGLGGVIRGQLMICLINGALSGIGFAIAGLRYWPVWTLLATVASLVPIFGTIVSSVPAIAIGLTQGWGTGLFVFIWIVGIHELEANVFNPKIMGDAAKMHPVIVIFALLAGAHAGGVLGALLGVPVASILQSLFRFLRARVYRKEESESLAASCTGAAESPEPADDEDEE